MLAEQQQAGARGVECAGLASRVSLLQLDLAAGLQLPACTVLCLGIQRIPISHLYSNQAKLCKLSLLPLPSAADAAAG